MENPTVELCRTPDYFAGLTNGSKDAFQFGITVFPLLLPISSLDLSS